MIASLTIFQVLPKLVNIHNGRRKVTRLAEEVLELAKHGVAVKPELAGLLPDQVKELGLVDEYEEQCVPSGGFAFDADPCQRRNGRAPTKAMKEVRIGLVRLDLKGRAQLLLVFLPLLILLVILPVQVLRKAVAEVKARVSKENVVAGQEVTEKTVQQCLELLSGATRIVWPMGLPPTDPVSAARTLCPHLSSLDRD